MQITPIKPEKILRANHQRQQISSESLLGFRRCLDTFIANLQLPAREGKQETDLRDFLNDAFYKEKYYINKKETIDWAIHNGKTDDSKIGVLIEVKRTSAKTEMITETQPNAKALHELMLYYLRERIDNNNQEIRHLIATNCYEWYVFDERWFNENIFTTELQKAYKDRVLLHHNTDEFYKYNAKPYLDNLKNPIAFCKIDIRDYAAATDQKLAELYKILSPEHLLKQEIANDANKLNKPFYNELLYIMGIEERKDDKSNKKIIDRLPPQHRNEGSLLENTIGQLEAKNALTKTPNLGDFGDTEAEQKYSVALELCITWLNRLLFLKLLEGQLVKYHNDANYRFLSSDKVTDFDELGELFFGVLAKAPADRTASVQQKFGNIPYLNSSLFEESVLETNVLSIELLKDRLTMPFFGSTVLTDHNNKNRIGDAKTLKYLLDFLGAYSFGSSADVTNVGETIINAAVLGLIFEKLNGYKDGSFFTPSFITMYMCRETIRKAVVQKIAPPINEPAYTDFEDLKNRMGYLNAQKRSEYNAIVNAIKICDPAVGSGHFLVSALNEMIAVKAELGILQDRNGRLLDRYSISVENDELLVWDTETQSEFQYRVSTKNGHIGLLPELQRVQETLFHEKQTIIENCLFGVDINPKSVSICQLRLWIELLKNAYYKSDELRMTNDESKITHNSKLITHNYLQTLPNIDINIKTGNSLVSRFGLDTDLGGVLRSIKYSAAQYRGFVNDYKNATNKEQKRGLVKILDGIKANFKTEIAKYSNPKVVLFQKLNEELYARFTGNAMFGSQLTAKQIDERDRLTDKINTLKAEINETQNAKIYRNAFEWRFEFPEVLDDHGNFVGFDVVLGNPPYFSLSQEPIYKSLANSYKTYSATNDIYALFCELSNNILKTNGLSSFIVSNKWLRANYGKPLRKFLSEQTNLLQLIDFGQILLFENAIVHTNIISFQKNKPQNEFEAYEFKLNILPENIDLGVHFEQNKIQNLVVGEDVWNIVSDDLATIRTKIETHKRLKDWDIKINFGIKTGYNEAFIIDKQTKNKLLAEDPNNADIIKPILRGRDTRKYHCNFADLYLINAHNGYKNVSRIDVVNDYPSIYQYLQNYEEQASIRFDKGVHWTNLRNCAYLEEFAKPKIVFSEIVSEPQFHYDTEGYYPEATVFFISGQDLKYLIALLNSKAVTFFFKHFYMGGELVGKIRYKKAFLENVPIPVASPEAQAQIIQKVDAILLAKMTPSLQGTVSLLLEAEIDDLVYDLYDLTAEERAVVAGEC
jgi:adenine-specific DNA-methyltransferase